MNTTWTFDKLIKDDMVKIREMYTYMREQQDSIKQLENLIRDMLFDIPVIPDRYKYVNRLKEIKELINE